MFYVGICIDESRSDHAAVVVEKVLRNAIKQYHVHDIHCLPSKNKGGDPVMAINDLYRAPDYIRKKTVFSQSKRPAKNTLNPPTVLIHENTDGSPVTECLRERQVPVEAFCFHGQEGWYRKDRKIIRQGGDLYLHPDAMTPVSDVIRSSRLSVPPDPGPALDLCREIERYMGAAGGPQGPPDVFSSESFVFLPSLFLILWHCETIRRIKRY